MGSRALLNGWPLAPGKAGPAQAAPPAALIISGTPGAAVVGDNPTFAPLIAGGTAPYTLSIASGTLPPGRTVNGSAKTVTGAYTTAGNFAYVLRATDALGATADLSVSVVVSAASTLLALSEPMVIGGNSYDAQSGNINTWLFAMIESGGRGLNSVGFNQSRGGDRLTHLLDRIKPMKAQRSGIPFIMNIENDLSDSLVTNDTAGGDLAKARLDAVRSELVGVRSGAKLIAALGAGYNDGSTTGDTVAIANKPIAFARYKQLVQADPNYDFLNEGAVFNPRDATQSLDNVHPATVKSAKAVGKQRGAKIASAYVGDPMLPADGVMPTSIHATAFNPATAWTVSSSAPGLTVTQSQGFLRDNPSRPCRIFTVTGTATQDETLSTTAPDAQLRYGIGLKAIDIYAMPVASLMRMEVRSVAGGAPVGLATMQFNNGLGQSFSKQHIANQGYAWEEGSSGVLPIAPDLFNAQGTSINFDMRFRGKLGVAVDFEIRIADLNVYETDTVAFGAPAFAGYIFTAGRPILTAAPTITPAAGSTIAVGGTIAPNVAGRVYGGNAKLASRTWTVWRDGAQVGTMTPPKNGVAAVPYTAVSADSGKTLEIRQTVDNGLGTDTFVIGTITVS